MKKIITLTLILTACICNAQKLEKVKGSKIVVLSERVFEEVKSLELNKDISITLMKGTENKLSIYADDNLHSIVATDLTDSHLNIEMTNRIAGKKKFELTLYLIDIDQIVMNANSKITNANYFETENISLLLNNKADANLFIDAKNTIDVEMNDNAKAEVSLKGNDLMLTLQESSKLKANLTFDKIQVANDQKSNATLSGKVNDLFIEAKNTSKLKAANLRAEKSEVTAENGADVYVNTDKELKISAEGKAKVYIYGSPKIDLVSFKNTASLLKKE